MSGSLIVAFCRLHAVCAKIRPFNEDSVKKLAAVLTKRMPSICAPEPTVTSPATCQKMFFACAEPDRSTFVFAA
jgi:hypothetical protein